MSEVNKQFLDPATIALIAKIVSDLLILIFMKTVDTGGMTDEEKEAFLLVEKAKTDSEVAKLLAMAQA